VAVRANTKLIEQTAGGTPRPSVDARKAYELAKRRVREAEDKYEVTRRWIRVIQKEVDQYRGSVQPMAVVAQACMTRGPAMIDSLMSSIDSYLSTATPEQSDHSQSKVVGNESGADGSQDMSKEDPS
jgi:hypothetical protein